MIHLALAGCGLMGSRHLMGLKQLKDSGFGSFELIAVSDLDSNRALELAENAKLVLGEKPRVYSTSEAMFEEESSLDAVDIVTNLASHHTICCRALESALHVMVEKPMAVTVKACRMIVEYSEKFGRMVSVAENYRRDPMNRLVKAILERQVIGRPYLVSMSSVGASNNILLSPWRHMKNEGGILLDMGVHYADLLTYLLGEVDEVFAEISLFERLRYRRVRDGDRIIDAETVECTAPDTALAILKFRNGVKGQWLLGVAGHGETLWHRIVYGSKGSIECGLERTGTPPRVKLVSRSDYLDRNPAELFLGVGDEAESRGRRVLEEIVGQAYDDLTRRIFGEIGIGYRMSFEEADRKLLAIELRDFADSVEKGRKPEVDCIAGLKSVAFMYSMFESAIRNEPVRLSDVESGAFDSFEHEINRSLSL